MSRIFSKIISYFPQILALLFITGFAVYAWTEPSQSPPGGNVSAPLNIGPTGQSKEGGLILNTGGATYGLIIDKGNVGIGTGDTGNYKFKVSGLGNITGGLNVGSGFEVDQTGIPSWSGKKFNGWVQMTVPTTQNVCMPADCYIQTGTVACVAESCSTKCAASGCTSLGAFHSSCGGTNRCEISGGWSCGYTADAGCYTTSCSDEDGGGFRAGGCLCSCPGASAPFLVPSFQ